MKEKLKSIPDFADKDVACDCVWLLKAIQGITYHFDGRMPVYMSLEESEIAFKKYIQRPEESVDEYVEHYRALLDVHEHYGGSVGNHKGAIEQARKENPDPRLKIEDLQRIARDRTLALGFVMRADRKRFGLLLTELKNNYGRKLDQFPKDLNEAYALLVHYEPPEAFAARKGQNSNSTAASNNAAPTTTTPSIVPVPTTSNEDAMTFVVISGKDGVTHQGITCHACGDKGHYSPECPGKSGVQILQIEMPSEVEPGFVFSQNSNKMIPPHWVLLDSQSTVSVFHNKSYLTNIRKSAASLTVYTNGGTQVSDHVGDVKNFGPVWYNPDSLANILSLAAVRKLCRVTMDTAVEAAILVHRTNGRTMKFQEFSSGLYFHDPTTAGLDYSFVSTVAANKACFTPREVECADAALSLHRKLGRPSQRHFETILRDNLICNCPVTVHDAKRAVLIYGPCVASLQGTATKKPSEHVPTLVPKLLPRAVMERHKAITLCMDVFYVQKVAFFHTISRKIGFRTASVIADKSKRTLLHEARNVLSYYHSRGFTVPDIHVDHEFECLRYDLAPSQLNVTPADDHVGEVERSIRTIKERVRTTIHGLPFRRLPRLMIRELVFAATKSLNQFPATGGVSATMSPATIMTGRPGPDFAHLKLEFGSYVQVFEDNDPTNTTKSRNTGAITLSHTGNAQGDYFFMSLVTGRRLSRHAWTAVPMPNAVIATVERMAELEQQPLIEGGLPLFEWGPNVPILNGPHDQDEPIPAGDVPVPVDDVPIIGNVDLEAFFDEADNLEADHVLTPVEPCGVLFVEPDGELEEGALNDNANIDDNEFPIADGDDEFPIADGNEGNGDDDNADADNADANDDNEPHYNLRSNRELSYDHRYDHQFLQHAVHTHEADPRALHKYLVGHVMTQMTASAGIKKHGQAAVDALMQEFLQLEKKDVFEVVDASTLDGSQKRAALRAINLIKEKRSGKIKGRTCADGSSQRVLYTKEETTSPTISSDALMLTLLVDAKERRDVATADVEGAYLNAKMDDFVLMRFSGDTVDILCDVNPDYTPFVIMDQGKRTLFLRLKKALYGCVKSALLWYDLFVSVLLDLGFVLNPYDSCVANCFFEGSQCTIGWYVDDMKISHANQDVVSHVIAQIEERFGKMTVTRGLQHNFLGMDITFNQDETVTVDMSEYVCDTLASSGIDLSGSTAPTPAKRNLFELDEASPLLSKESAELFHRVVAKLLYLSKRGRTDIQLAIAFLTTRVSRSTEQDFSKLRRVLQYLNGTKDLFLTLGADSLCRLKTWVDAAYAVHADLKSHTGGAVSMGRGAFLCKSTKQKLNTKSSTEAEVVGASDFLPSTIWARMFLREQGYTLTLNEYAQDNQSAILLERNGRASSGQKTRHIDIRYFFMQDRISTEGITIVHCPTAAMLADFFTKPLQGALFKRFRSVILGYAPISSLDVFCLPIPASLPIEERVGINESHSASGSRVVGYEGLKRSYADAARA